MAEKEEELLKYQYYGITFTIITDNLLTTKDIQTFNIIRSPLHKIASFAILTCALESSLYTVIESYIRLNKVLLCEVTLNLVDKEKPVENDSTERKIIKELLKKTYHITYCKSAEINFRSGHRKSLMPLINFFLINPTILYLSNRQNYNLLLENTTSIQALESIEALITKDFKDTFNFKDFRLGITPNKYKYEHILIRSCSDIIAPMLVIKNYKVINEFSFYFFDDFYYTDIMQPGHIAVHFICLDKKTPFKQIDISSNKYKDFLASSHLIKSVPISDKNNFFSNESKKSHIVKVDNNGEWEFIFNKEKSTNPQFIGKNKDDKSEKDFKRNSYSKEFSFQEIERKNGTDLLRLYSPERGDKENNCLSRFLKCSDLYRNQLMSICDFEANSVFLDMLQFNCCYNMELNNISDYSHVPINIVNTFSRAENSSKYYIHKAKFQTLQFKPSVADGLLINNI